MISEPSLRQRLAHAGLTTWLLAAVCGWALLLWLAALAGMGGRLAEAVPQPPGPLPAPLPPAPDRIGPLGQYAEAAARPLFTEDRRPRAFIASVGSEEDAGSGSRVDFVLTGVVISPQVRLAIVQPANGGEAQRVREGATPDGAPGWRLLSVQPRRAVFDSPSGQVTLDLRVFGAPAPPPGLTKPEEPASAADDGGATGDSAALDELRRRIEARRAQLQETATPSADAPAKPLSGPGK